MPGTIYSSIPRPIVWTLNPILVNIFSSRMRPKIDDQNQISKMRNRGQDGKKRLTTIENESRFGHRVINLLPIESLEFVPFSCDNDSFSSDASIHRGGGDGDLRLRCKKYSRVRTKFQEARITRLITNQQRGHRELQVGSNRARFGLREPWGRRLRSWRSRLGSVC